MVLLIFLKCLSAFALTEIRYSCLAVQFLEDEGLCLLRPQMNVFSYHKGSRLRRSSHKSSQGACVESLSSFKTEIVSKTQEHKLNMENMNVVVPHLDR